MNARIRERLKKIKMFILDMDGTIYLGNELFPCTKPFLRAVRETGRDYRFFTNNSSKNRRAYVEKLSAMGIDASPGEILTANEIIIKWLKENEPGGSCYLVGTSDLRSDFRRARIPLSADADYVVLGFDTSLTYDKLRVACDLIRRGKPFYAVNPDLNCPVENGFIPDCGSMAKLIETSTGIMPEFFGKPSRKTLDYILEKTGVKQNELCFVGDRLYTDIAVKGNSRALSILVMSGETTPEMLAESEIRPNLVFEDLSGITRELLGFVDFSPAAPEIPQ